MKDDKRIALVTGAVAGIGLAAAHAFGESGYRVLINSRRRSRAEECCEELRRDEVEAYSAAGDVTDPGDVARMAAAVEERLGRLDVLINNVGPFFMGDVTRHSDEQWRDIFDGNVGSVLTCCRAFLPLLERSPHPRIINIGVSYADVRAGRPGFGLYAAAKAAVLSLTRTLAVELAPQGVTVNSVSPGMIDTGVYSEGTMQRYEEVIPAGRFGTPDEVARVVCFLAEPESDYITGADIPVAGGWTGERP